MDDPNSIIQAQKEQIARYQTRLKDVVTAYKSLLNEKQALEAVLSAKKPKQEGEEGTETEEEDDKVESTAPISVLMDSIKTLSDEKKKMEASFLSDKKNLRQELQTKDIVIKDLQEKSKALELERQNLKTKLFSCDRILNDERHLKENLETQLNQLKTQFSQTSNSDKVINSLNQELSEVKKKLKSYENNKLKDDSNVLQTLQLEMENLKQQHMNNLMVEKQRANEANERNKKLTALHEERVQNLESRIAELSRNFAHYHQLRESDQKSIIQLKEKISQLQKPSDNFDDSLADTSCKKFSNVYQIIDELQKLKQLLVYENTKLEHPIDLTYIFPNSTNNDVTVVSAEKYALVKNEREKLVDENEVLKNQLTDQNESLKTLQEKVIVLNRNIDEYETEIKNKSISLINDLKAERTKNREVINNLEADYRSKISQLEQQLQKQRERSLMLLDEKENEIRALKTSYELFIPKKSSTDYEDETQSNGSRKPSTSQQHHLGMVLNQQNSNSSNSPETYMIFYSNELARKDLELSSVRKSKRECEELIRQTLKEKIMIQEELDEKIANLEQKVYYLEKMKSREGANLEYLKNVTISYLTTSDAQAKKKMLNAIGAVLKFDDSENILINNYFGKRK
ncbi:unnamed protein product [Chironomus riparius]|uniref:GRIP domain-containing protein n=1 Tax=Chironomus riparius TaxID=315576 RepID=A0A9N9RSK0_9DIPT|nr:unnamed protein product [Chironomus riparius]